jgi:hypothetical protein
LFWAYANTNVWQQQQQQECKDNSAFLKDVRSRFSTMSISLG